MKSILENRPELAYEVNQAAEVAGYLWRMNLQSSTVSSPS